LAVKKKATPKKAKSKAKPKKKIVRRKGMTKPPRPKETLRKK
jgi:hypothetical protein